MKICDVTLFCGEEKLIRSEFYVVNVQHLMKTFLGLIHKPSLKRITRIEIHSEKDLGQNFLVKPC